MKHLLSFLIITNLLGTTQITAFERIKKPKPKPVVIQENDEDEYDDDEDEKVVLANFANMAHSMTQLSDPATVGPALISFFMSVFNIGMQMCKNMALRTDITPENVQVWFNDLSPQTQQELTQMMIKLGKEKCYSRAP